MSRIGRIVVPGVAHHTTQRGNNRQAVFFVDDDRRVYLKLLWKYGVQFGFQVAGYCLMTNHIHVVGVPARDRVPPNRNGQLRVRRPGEPGAASTTATAEVTRKGAYHG